MTEGAHGNPPINTKRVLTRVFWVRLLLCVLLGGILAFSVCMWVRRCSAEDPWDRPPGAEGPEEWRWRELPGARIHEVIDAKQSEAQALLKDVAAVQITNEQAAELVGQPLPDVPSTAPYLVRSLYYVRSSGRYVIRTYQGYLYVFHGSMGYGFGPPLRLALVLQLEDYPTEVYVSASVAR